MKKDLAYHINSNKKKYMFLLMAFILGILLGYATLMMLKDEITAELTEFMGENLKSFLSYSEDLDKAAYFREVFFSELWWFVIMWIAGMSVLGVFFPPAFLLYKGYIFGFTFAFMLRCFDGKGLLFDILVLISQNVIKIPVLLFASMCTMSHALKKTPDNISKRKPKGDIGITGAYTLCMIFSLAAYAVGILLECYVIPHFVFLLAKDMV